MWRTAYVRLFAFPATFLVNSSGFISVAEMIHCPGRGFCALKITVIIQVTANPDLVGRFVNCAHSESYPHEQ
jgi:hypothetical protein